MTENPLSGVRIKIDRAKKHFDELNREMRMFKSREPYVVMPYTDIDSRDEIYKLWIVEEIPHSWGGAIGDVVHNLRSAFDLLANALVLDNGVTPTKDTKFPISSSSKRIDDYIASALQGAASSSIALVKRIKPYPGGNDTLWRLHQIDIVDKHRLLVPVGGAHSNIKWTVSMPNPFGEGHLPPMTMPIVPTNRQFPLENGAVLLRTKSAPGITDKNQNQYEFVFDIAFGEGQIFDGESVSVTLKQLIDFTERVVDIFARYIFKAKW